LQESFPERRPRHAWADNLKVVLVTGVIVTHATVAWTGVGNWVFKEPPVREPLLGVLVLCSAVGALFGMALFFLIAGVFTPQSFERKGLRRFLVDRAIRLGVPLMFFVGFLAPVIEYVDPENAGWNQGFVAFAPTVWWSLPPAWGPTWFLPVLLLFSAVYAVARGIVPGRTTGGNTPRAWHLAAAATVVALTTFLVRFEVPLGAEPFRLGLGQAPAWIIGFVLGVVGAERGWYDPIRPQLAYRARHVAWATIGALAVMVGAAMAVGADIDAFAGGGTWQSLVTAALEGSLVVSVPLWLMDVFRRRWNHQGRLARAMSRAALAAYVLHQIVLVGFVLASRYVQWPPEVKYVTVSAFAVCGSFALGMVVVRLPHVSRMV
jgi:fucose 4-O-acetylase-like acetyltransferase